MFTYSMNKCLDFDRSLYQLMCAPIHSTIWTVYTVAIAAIDLGKCFLFIFNLRTFFFVRCVFEKSRFRIGVRYQSLMCTFIGNFF